ncbi:MAG TPA: 50S ribosomal protein L11 methyltransferase [Candidatus Limnocylindrales bacterium]|nr:50S ribosomal protein L11 methyltransferase [Candidatus Limnocylindrales bacterium]
MIRQAGWIRVRGPMEDAWYEIVLEVPLQHSEAAAASLAARGFSGCELREHGGGASIVVFTQAPSLRDATGVAQGAASALADMPFLAGCPSPNVVVRELDPRVWTQNWRRHFARHTIGGRIEILPPWEEPSPPVAGVISIVINPGMAFGTGLHETTAGCIEALIANVKAGDRVLDLGCGSAILAIAAARLGAREVVAIDNDPIAVEAAEENIERNGVGDIVRARLARENTETSVGTNIASEADGGAYDLVVANILAETLVEMQGRLTANVAERGVLVLSGIESSRLAMVKEAFVRPGWNEVSTLERGEWVTVVLHREPLAPRT